jgi:integrase/recombinase XerD
MKQQASQEFFGLTGLTPSGNLTGMSHDTQQLSLFDNPIEPAPAPITPAPDRSKSTAPKKAKAVEAPRSAPIDQPRPKDLKLTAQASLKTAIEAYADHLDKSDLSINTRKSFIYDLHILIEFATPTKPIGQIAQKDLEHFMDWLVDGRGVPCNPKSLSRRVVSLKAFFRWLTKTNVIENDPAAPIAHKPVSTPLPDVLSNDQVDQILAATQRMRGDADKPDTRPHLLVTLLLATGIKKSECMAIKLEHIDLSEADQPAVWIRYTEARNFHKERKLKLDPKWPRVFDQYKQQYTVQDALFPCTSRTLEYALADVSQLAGLPKPLSFEMLRWTCAVRDRRAGMKEETLRHKLGLSQITWAETWPKIEKLASPAL